MQMCVRKPVYNYSGMSNTENEVTQWKLKIIHKRVPNVSF